LRKTDTDKNCAHKVIAKTKVSGKIAFPLNWVSCMAKIVWRALATCSCGNVITTRSTVAKEIHIDTCSSCHPFYTGKQKVADTGGRIDRFKTSRNVLQVAVPNKRFRQLLVIPKSPHSRAFYCLGFSRSRF